MPASLFSSLIGAWAPGSGLFKLPSNMGIKINSNYDYVVEVHYAPGSLNQADSTKINLKFTDVPASSTREVYVDAVLEYFFGMTDGPLFVPANTVKTFHEALTVSGYDVSVLGVFPHMHKVGTSFKSWALNPSGDTTRLIDIPKWSFHWQGFYNYQKLIPVFNGTTIWGEATYDNTTNNPDNPNNPPQDVHAGEHTTDEMMIGFYAYTLYYPGDENVILDSTLLTGTTAPDSYAAEIEVFPNPVSELINVSILLKENGLSDYHIYDVKGMVVQSGHNENAAAGKQQLTIPVNRLAAGMYLLHITTAEGSYATKFIKE